MTELDLFVEALNKSDPAAFLDEACAGNPELRRRLGELLAGLAEAIRAGILAMVRAAKA
jgi:hypothetical protein